MQPEDMAKVDSGQEMKPCPFCGREPIYDMLPGTPGAFSATGEMHIISCRCNGFSGCSSQFGTTREAALEAWNRRTPMTITAAILRVAQTSGPWLDVGEYFVVSARGLLREWGMEPES